MRAESDEHDAFIRVRLANQLSDVDHPRRQHVGIPGVADVRVVLPDDRLRQWTVLPHEAVQRLEHVAVAYVPRPGTTADHRPIIQLRISRDQCVLLRIEETIITVFFYQSLSAKMQ